MFSSHELVLNFVLLLSMAGVSIGMPSVATQRNEMRTPTISIDLKTCGCKPRSSTECDIVIGKSFVPNIDCAVTERLCCSFEKPAEKTVSANSNATDPATVKTDQARRAPTVRIKEVTALEGAKPETKHSTPSKKSPSKKCRCKTRDKCPPIYTDYSFGFYCTYDKVRCCEPIQMGNKTTDGNFGNSTGGIYETPDNNGGRLINVLTPSLTGSEGTGQKGNQCVCVSEIRCRNHSNITVTNATLQERKDPCLNNLIQCCGEVLPETESKTNDSRFSDTEEFDGEELDPNFIAHRSDQGLKPGIFANVEPIGLPVMKIPDAETTEDRITSTMAPPKLPDQYHYPANNADPQYTYVHHPESVEATPVPAVNFRPTLRTWIDKYGNKYLVDHQGRASLIVTGRASPTSFLSSLAGYFG